MKNNTADNLLNTTPSVDLSLDDILDFIDNHQGAGKGATVASTKPMIVDTKELMAMMAEVKNNQVISIARLGVRLLKEKKEDLIFKANQFTKVRNETGLAKRPVVVSIDMYVNPESGTFTIIEYHPTYESYCVISYGNNFQVFIGGVQ